MNSEQFKAWLCKRDMPSHLSLHHRPLIMGILNVTPDSFSDGGQFIEPDKAVAQALSLIGQGADIIDIGGESSRPGAQAVSLDEELDRVIPVIQKLHSISDVCISIDTYKPAVMEAAINAGAAVINDIRALTHDGALETAAKLQVPVCLMHMKGRPDTMQDNPHYENNIIDAINTFFEERVQACLTAGIKKEHLILDPGFGFGKTVSHNLLMVRNLHKFLKHGLPVMIGLSRKSTLGQLVNKPVNQRLIAGLTLSIVASLNKVDIIRTHDVDETSQTIQVLQALEAVELSLMK